MKRYVVIAALALAAFGACLAIRWYVNRDARSPAFTEADFKDLAKRMGRTPITPAEATLAQTPPLSLKVRLALVGLQVPGNQSGAELEDLVVAGLSRSEGLELVERSALKLALGEGALSRSSQVPVKELIHLGQLIKADWFLLGSARKVGARNLLLVRLVETRRAVIRDLTVISLDRPTPQIAEELCRFVNTSRKPARKASGATYLAIGALANVGVNSGPPEFPQQFRAYLTEKAASKFLVLEREAVAALLQEASLDLAGLVKTSTNEPAIATQAAYWLVDGYYQSADLAGSQVDLAVNITRLFGPSVQKTFKGKADQRLFQQIEQSIQSVIAASPAQITVPTLGSELRRQVAIGRELFNVATGGTDPLQMPPPGFTLWEPRAQPDKLRAWDLEEAMNCFRTALLLDPHNQQARFLLGSCLRDRTIARYDQAVDALRQAVESDKPDQWSQAARIALAGFYQESNPREAAKWFRVAAANSSVADSNNFSGMALALEGEARLAEAQASSGPKLPAEALTGRIQQLRNDIEDCQHVLEGKSGGYRDDYGVEHFLEAFEGRTEQGLELLNTLLAQFSTNYPKLYPHLVAAVAAFQADTNAAPVVEFRNLLASLCSSNTPIFAPNYFFRPAYLAYDSVMKKKDFALAAEIVETRFALAAMKGSGVTTDSKDKVRLGLAYQKMQRWRDALQIFDELGNSTVVMGSDGVWGRAFTPFVPAQAAAVCRKNIEAGSTQTTRLLHFDRPNVCMHVPSVFCVTNGALWLAIGGRLIRTTLDFQTNQTLALGVSDETPVTALCVGLDRIWVGTAGEGLVECSLANSKCRVLRQSDGLLMDHISSMCLGPDALWIGYGDGSLGGLGKLDLKTGAIASFTPPLEGDLSASATAERPDAPPRHPVTVTCWSPDAELWLLIRYGGLRKFTPGRSAWEPVDEGFRPGAGASLQCFDFDAGALFGGFSVAQTRLIIEESLPPGSTNPPTLRTNVLPVYEADKLVSDPRVAKRIRGSIGAADGYIGELRRRSRDKKDWELVSSARDLPGPPTALHVHGKKLFLGGPGYLALFDPVAGKVQEVCPISARAVDQLTVSGGYLWAKFDRHLYRVPWPKPE